MARAVLAGLLLSCSIAPVSAAETIDEDLMYDIDDLHAALKGQLAKQDSARVASAAKKLQSLLAQVEAFYSKDPKTLDAATFAHKAREASAQLEKSSATADWSGAAAAYQALSTSCKSCHSRYSP